MPVTNPPSSPTPPPHEPIRYVSYSRVSGDFQKQKQLSIPAQQRECRDHAFGRGGLLLREWVDEAITGETLNRPGLQEILEWAKAGGTALAGATLAREKDKDTGKPKVLRNGHLDVVVVWKLDRLSRPDADMDLDFLLIRRDLRLVGVRIESATEAYVESEDPLGQLMGYLGRGQTGMEAAERLKRFRLGREGAAREQGRQNGPPPYGYDWKDPEGGTRSEMRRGRPWAPIEPAASWVCWIFEHYLAGESVNEIVRGLNALGVPQPCRTGDGGRRGGTIQHSSNGWTHDSVYKILRNRRYAGFIWLTDSAGNRPDGGEWIDVTGKPQAHPALITSADWERAQEVTATRGKGRAAGASALFASGLLRCPRCAARGEDTALVVASQPQRRYLTDGSYNVHTYTSYGCYSRRRFWQRRLWGQDPEEDCPGYQIGQKRVLTLLTAYLQRLSRGVKAADLADLRTRAEALRPRPEQADTTQARRADIERQLTQLPAMRTNLQMQQALGYMDMDKLGTMLGEVQDREAALRAAQDALAEDKVERALAPVQAAYLLRLLEDPEAPALQKRDALGAFISRIVPGLDRKSLRVYLRGPGGD